jgi:hypothetical protein
VQNDVVTAVPDEEERAARTLLQAFAVQPNPFRERATIQWSPTLGSPRLVEIYRVDGRRIRSAAVGPNERSFLWDGRSDAGVQQPAGLYFVRLRDASGRVLGSRKVLRLG